MINLCIVCADSDLAQQVASGLRDAGASHVEVLADSDLGKEQNKSTRNNRHIFIVQSPQEKLLSILPSELSEQAFAEDLSGWYKKQSDLMSVYEAQRSSSILVSHGLVENHFVHLVQLINKKWRQRLAVTFPDGGARLPSTDTSTTASPFSNQRPFVGYLMQGLIEQTPNLRQMQSTIEQATGTAPILFDVFAAMGSYREDSQRTAKKIGDLEGLHQTLKFDFVSTQKQKLELENQHQSLKAELESTKQQNKDLETLLKDAREEGELLLTQLHQDQEKLESYFLKLKDSERLHATQQRTLKSELEATKQRSKDLEGKLKVTQEESQKHAKRAAELEAQHLTLTSELAAAQHLNNDLDTKLKEATTESGLLLVQLHQVQEELENYFLKFKDAENRYGEIQFRRRKMLNKYPDYVDYEWVGVEATGKDQALSWQFKSLESAGVSRDKVTFETFIEKGLLGVRFRKTPVVQNQEKTTDNISLNSHDICQTLMQWPRASAHLDEVECIPAGSGEIKSLRANVLRELSTSDWRLLRIIPTTIFQSLEERFIEGVDTSQVKRAASRLHEALDRLPPVLRYDRLTLKNHQTNPDYEHLWFVFENMTLDEQVWPIFEIRLGAANIKAGEFSESIKIEIPLINGKTKPFESWFEESVDDYGKKWELRFDIKKKIMDTSVRSGLKSDEQFLIRSLITELVNGGLRVIEFGIKHRDLSQWETAFSQCLEIVV